MKKLLLISISILLYFNLSSQTLQQADSAWLVIRNETGKGANTATRVGNSGRYIIAGIRDTLANFTEPDSTYNKIIIDSIRTKTGNKIVFKKNTSDFTFYNYSGNSMLTSTASITTLKNGNGAIQFNSPRINIFDYYENTAIVIDTVTYTYNYPDDSGSAIVIKPDSLVINAVDGALAMKIKDDVSFSKAVSTTEYFATDTIKTLDGDKNVFIKHPSSLAFYDYNGNTMLSSTASITTLKDGNGAIQFNNPRINHFDYYENTAIVIDTTTYTVTYPDDSGDAIIIKPDSLVIKSTDNAIAIKVKDTITLGKALTTTSTIDGRDVSVDGAKLDASIDSATVLTRISDSTAICAKLALENTFTEKNTFNDTLVAPVIDADTILNTSSFVLKNTAEKGFIFDMSNAALAFGVTEVGGTITSSGYGAMASGYTYGGTISASYDGAYCFAYTGTGATASTSSGGALTLAYVETGGTVSNSGSGSLLITYDVYGATTSNESQGSLVLCKPGNANRGNTNSGHGSIVAGDSIYNQFANYSFNFGREFVNDVAESFNVGYGKKEFSVERDSIKITVPVTSTSTIQAEGIYGEIIVDSVTTAQTVVDSTWTKVTAFNLVGENNLVTAVADSLVIQVTGKYEVQFNFATCVDVKDITTTMALYKNGAKTKLVDCAYVDKDLGTFNLNGSRILSLTAGDVLDCRIYHTDVDSADITLNYGSLSVLYISNE